MSLFANPEVKSFVDRLIGGAAPSPGGGVRGGSNPLAAALAGIVRPEMATAFPATPIRPGSIAPSPEGGGGPRGLIGQSLGELPKISASAGGLGRGALAAGIGKLGTGIEGGLQELAAKRATQQQIDAMAKMPGLPPLPPLGSSTPVHTANGAPPSKANGAASSIAPETFQPIGAGSETPILAQSETKDTQTVPSIGSADESLPTFAQGASGAATADSGAGFVKQFLTGIKAGEGIPSYSGHSSTGALGPYGLTRDFITDWGAKAGLPTDKASYEGNQALQDQLATYAATKMHDQFGSWPQVANAWLTGGPTKTTSAPGNMSPAAYDAKVMNAANATPSDAVSSSPSASEYAATSPTSLTAPSAVAEGPSSQSVIPGQTDPHKPGFDPSSVPFQRTPEMDQGQSPAISPAAPPANNDLSPSGAATVPVPAPPEAPLINGGQPGVYSMPGQQGLNDLPPLDQQMLLALALAQNQPDSGGLSGLFS